MKAQKFKSRIGELRHLPGNRYLEIPPKVVQALGGKFNVRFICTVNGKVSFQGGLVALGLGRGYVSITKKRLKELGLEIGDTAEVVLKPDKSRFGMELPEELEELLRQDPEGLRRFEMLTPGKQRYVILYVRSVKSPDLRIDRAMLLIDNLKNLPEGKESFREMLGLPKHRR